MLLRHNKMYYSLIQNGDCNFCAGRRAEFKFIYLQLNSAFLVLRPSPCTELRESAGLEGASKSQLSKEFVLKMGLMRE
jgi:hypothetical protein